MNVKKPGCSTAFALSPAPGTYTSSRMMLSFIQSSHSAPPEHRLTYRSYHPLQTLYWNPSKVSDFMHDIHNLILLQGQNKYTVASQGQLHLCQASTLRSAFWLLHTNFPLQHCKHNLVFQQLEHRTKLGVKTSFVQTSLVSEFDLVESDLQT